VTLGERDQSTGLVVVQSGVRAGEQVVVVPSEVKEGTPVTLAADIGASVPAADSAASAAATSGAKE
jgi:DNA-binding IclR family transcriptional regulator